MYKAVLFWCVLAVPVAYYGADVIRGIVGLMVKMGGVI